MRTRCAIGALVVAFHLGAECPSRPATATIDQAGCGRYLRIVSDETLAKRPKQRRGFAVMDPELQREISSEGGKARAASGKGYVFTHETAVEAGRLGGLEKARRDRERKEKGP